MVDLNRGLFAIYGSDAASVSVISGLVVAGISTFFEIIFELFTCLKLIALRNSTQNNVFKNKQEIKLFGKCCFCFTKLRS